VRAIGSWSSKREPRAEVRSPAFFLPLRRFAAFEPLEPPSLAAQGNRFWRQERLRRDDRFWRVSDHRPDAGGRQLELDLLGHVQSVVYLNPEISDGALQLRMTEEELHCAQAAVFAIYLGGLRTPDRVRAIKGRL
jgi:hypothetical protein